MIVDVVMMWNKLNVLLLLNVIIIIICELYYYYCCGCCRDNGKMKMRSNGYKCVVCVYVNR